MKLLVVEDERRMLELLHQGLTEEGHTVWCATDGIEGLSLASGLQFDAVILDVMIPNVDGFEVAHRMRKAHNFTPVLMLTAKDTVPDIVNGLELGADDYMTKPFSFNELLLRLRAVTRHARTSQNTRLQTGGLLLDCVSHEVFQNGARVVLSKREYCLLERLMRDAGSVVSREALLDAVWGKRSGVETNTLDVYVRLLRNKIEGEQRGKFIRTVRGVGYAICTEE